LSVLPSPFDVPEAVRFAVQRRAWWGHDRQVIEFAYIGNEPLREVRLSGGVEFLLGRFSGRLHQIAFDPEDVPAWARSSPVNALQFVASTIHSLVETSPRPRRSRNYQLAQEALQMQGDQVFSAFVG